MSDPRGAAVAPEIRFPSGETKQMTELAEQLKHLLRHDGLTHLVLYDGDTATVALDAPGPDPSAAPPLTLSPDSSDHEQTGRQIYYLLEELQPDFSALRTGALIRTVLRVPSGAVLYYQVEPGFHLYGATSAVHHLDELDASMATCVNALRLPARLSPLNYGSWFDTATWALVAGAGTPSPPDEAALRLPPEEYTHVQRPADTTPPTRVEEFLSKALDVQALHYVAYHTSPGTAWAYDVFDHPGVGHFFRVRTPDARRTRYARLSRLLPGVVERMNLSLGAILRGELVQLVLDVEQGAVYFHALGDGRFLIGVTLDQTKVTAADHRLARLAKELPVDGPQD
ncbi:hypothetical protein ACIRU8_20350 [Streptomyces sp. NPDC101175]|uniref:hypothetical protein n=1 Tax=Streptomyces sp. NPDC101175 TaxID=3366123 RepID=UPI003838C150